MKRSPISPRDEQGSCNEELGYGPKDDLFKFLEEARNHAINFNFNLQDYSLPSQTSAVETTKSNKKKSWKRSICSWWKMDKKSSLAPQLEATLIYGSRVPKKKPSSVSGPVIGGGGRRGPGGRRQMSGLLAECFTPTRVVEEGESEFPYMCLSQQKYPSRQAFGPIYLVT